MKPELINDESYREWNRNDSERYPKQISNSDNLRLMYVGSKARLEIVQRQTGTSIDKSAYSKRWYDGAHWPQWMWQIDITSADCQAHQTGHWYGIVRWGSLV